MSKVSKITKYDKTVSELFKTSSSLLIPNSGPERARIVIREVVKKSSTVLKIKTHNFQLRHQVGNVPIDVWSWQPILQELESFLNRKGRLEVLMRNDNNFKEGHPVFDLLKNHASISTTTNFPVQGQVEQSQHRYMEDNTNSIGVLVKTLDDNLTADNENKLSVLPSLAIGDDVCFRQEIESKPNEFSAIACANAPHKANVLCDRFNQEWEYEQARWLNL